MNKQDPEHSEPVAIQDRHRTVAAAWLFLLEHGLCEPQEVIAWVDGEILRLKEAPRHLVELSMSGGSPTALATALTLLPGRPDPHGVLRLVFEGLRDALVRSPDRYKAVSDLLFQMSMGWEPAFPEAFPFATLISRTWEAAGLAESGVPFEHREEHQLEEILSILDERIQRFSAGSVVKDPLSANSK